MKKLRVFDFDDTLALTDSAVMVYKDGKPVRRLSSAAYKDYKLKDGESYSFKGFDEIINPQVIKPTMMVLRKVLGKPSPAVILTGRGEAQPIREWLSGIGVKPDAIIALGKAVRNSAQLAKAKRNWIASAIEKEGWEYIEVFEDSKENLAAMESLKREFPDVTFMFRYVGEYAEKMMHTMKMQKESYRDTLRFDTWRMFGEEFGKVLFSPDRTDTPKPPEKNTSQEQETWEAFKKHYIGGRDGDLEKALPALLDAKRKGLYKEFLDVPSNYKYAYRLMADMTIDIAKKALGVTINPEKGSKGVVGGGKYIPKGKVSSWTVEPAVLPQLLKDFGSLYRKNKDSYHVIAVALIAQNKDGFIINPDKYDDAPKMAGQFSYQKEIISVKPITMFKLIYCDKNEFNGSDQAILDWLMGKI